MGCRQITGGHVNKKGAADVEYTEDDILMATEEQLTLFIREFVKSHPLEPSCAGLYEALIRKFPEETRWTKPKDMVKVAYPKKGPWEITKTCPGVARGHCRSVTSSMNEALAMFGHRCNKTMLQSYCKECRNRSRRERRVINNAMADAKRAERQQGVLDGRYTARRR
jgi:hypothetical protein